MHVPPFPALLAVAVGVLLLLRLVGGSMPWGQLTIAVGPDGRPMRPLVKWHLWTICRGEPPLLSAVLGFLSILLGCLVVFTVGPELAETLTKPVARWLEYLMIFTLAASFTVVPVGIMVLVRSALDLTARRCSMVGLVVGLRRDVGLFGRTYRVAVQAGDRAMTKRLWAEAFRINRKDFERLRPGDKVTVEYSPHLRFVFKLAHPEPLKKAAVS